jgi:hypothetical protein
MDGTDAIKVEKGGNGLAALGSGAGLFDRDRAASFMGAGRSRTERGSNDVRGELSNVPTGSKQPQTQRRMKLRHWHINTALVLSACGAALQWIGVFHV